MYKLGLRPFKHSLYTARLMAVVHEHLNSLGPAPKDCFPWHAAPENALGGDGSWGMMGNDQVGDCVIADDGHQLQLWSANAGKLINPTTAQVLTEYSAITGYQPMNPNSDQGTDPIANAWYLQRSGFLVDSKNHKIDAWVPIDPKNVDHLKWATHLFGGVKFCWNLPNSAMRQFDAGKPWTVAYDDGGIAGGHDTLNVWYGPEGDFFPVTWGQRIEAYPDFADKYLDMAIAVLSKDIVNAQMVDAAGLKYDELVAKLKDVRH